MHGYYCITNNVSKGCSLLAGNVATGWPLMPEVLQRVAPNARNAKKSEQ
jgi:hypothetical protein